MPKPRQFSEEAVRDVTARIHHHRQAAEIVNAALSVLLEYLRAETRDSTPRSDEELVVALHASIAQLVKYAKTLHTQLSKEQYEPGLVLCLEWQNLSAELSELQGRSDAASIPLIRLSAMTARQLAVNTLAAAGTARRKEVTKQARDAASALHRLTSEYELQRAQQLLRATRHAARSGNGETGKCSRNCA
jgi:hypothetical protein